MMVPLTREVEEYCFRVTFGSVSLEYFAVLHRAQYQIMPVLSRTQHHAFKTRIKALWFSPPPHSQVVVYVQVYSVSLPPCVSETWQPREWDRWEVLTGICLMRL